MRTITKIKSMEVLRRVPICGSNLYIPGNKVSFYEITEHGVLVQGHSRGSTAKIFLVPWSNIQSLEVEVVDEEVEVEDKKRVGRPKA